VENWFQASAFKFSLYCYAEVREIVENKVVDFMCGETSKATTRETFLAMYREVGSGTT
jgi:ATP-dependent HslUV protease ATP-binding subunit HslU